MVRSTARRPVPRTALTRPEVTTAHQGQTTAAPGPLTIVTDPTGGPTYCWNSLASDRPLATPQKNRKSKVNSAPARLTGDPAMRCACCHAELRLARKVLLRSGDLFGIGPGMPDDRTYRAYVDKMTFRWAFVCFECYRRLDRAPWITRIGGQLFNMSARCCDERAAIVDAAKHQAYLRRQAAKLGLEQGHTASG